MTILDEAKQLRSEIARLRPDKRRRYPTDLKARILDWHARATAASMYEAEAAKILGIKSWRVTMWQRAATRAARATGLATEPLALVRVETPDLLPVTSLTVVTPSGHRVEGLGLTQVVALLREIA